MCVERPWLLAKNGNRSSSSSNNNRRNNDDNAFFGTPQCKTVAALKDPDFGYSQLRAARAIASLKQSWNLTMCSSWSMLKNPHSLDMGDPK